MDFTSRVNNFLDKHHRWGNAAAVLSIQMLTLLICLGTADRDAGVACLCTFGRHHDDTVGTACAVESRRGGVFQHRHGGHVGRVDVVPAAVIGRTVDDD